jgi:sulfur carrier protein
MKVLLNNENIVVDDGVTINELIIRIKVSHKYYAVEVNEQIVPKSLHTSFTLKEGDKVEIITAIGGG